MKATVIISAMMLALALAFGLWDERRSSALLGEERRLVGQAARMGIPEDEPLLPEASFKSASRKAAAALPAIDDEQIRDLISVFVGFDPTAPPNSDQKLKVLRFMNGVMSMSGPEIEDFIAHVRTMPGLDPGGTTKMVGVVLGVISSKHPEVTLRLLIGSPESTEDDDDMGREVMKNALMAWAEKEPDAALAWFREHEASQKRWVTDKTKMALVKGVARKDPVLAFRIAADLDPEVGDITRSMSMVVKTDEERSAMLNAMRAKLTAMPAGEARTGLENFMSINLAVGSMRGGFESSSRWLDESAYPDELMESVTYLAGRIVDVEEAGKWAEWIGKKVPTERGRQGISDMFGRWAVQNQNAAASWLEAAPSDEVKDAAIAGFAEAVSKKDPEAAAEWALTISSEPVRRRALNAIYKNWPKQGQEDAAAAAEFAKRHQISEGAR